MLALAGDIGGTNTRLALFSTEQGIHSPLAEETFASARYPSLESIVREFQSRVNLSADKASFGVAGPVVRGRAKITNLPWVMDEQELRRALGIQTVHLLNDLEAIANGVLALKPHDLHTLNAAPAAPGGAIAIVAPGTGLGEAYLTWDGTRYRAHPSEGGHTEFAPVSELQIGLLRYMLDRVEHASYERVCSGSGIPNIYAYLKESGHAEEPDWLARELAAADDPTPLIVNNALSGDDACDLCVLTLDTFVSILGTEAGNLALTIMATGGVYLGGGIPPRILPALQTPRFMEAFRDKGRMRGLVERMPVHVILNPKVALIGAACHCLESR
jgi:glucokinase